MKFGGMEPFALSKNVASSKTSAVQLVMSCMSEGDKYWFVCGSYWLGCYSNQIIIYKGQASKNAEKVGLLSRR
ncbi:hypothetical protein [Marinibactrum halimedae]|nr:hypothetical protein [Marinibactrum halimedae]MCD9460692.1 hypothetical protein [Marinibactrum halimedae]